MADVYEAHDRLLGRIVAIKVPGSALDRDGGFVERFRRRARAAAHRS
jgi:serine/threonine-protein kinase